MGMKNRNWIGAVAGLIGLALAGCAAPEAPAVAGAAAAIPDGLVAPDVYHQTAKLTAVMELLHRQYADSGRATYEKLLDGALRGMLRELDPYSGYQGRGEYREAARNFSGQRPGYGMTVQKRNNQPLTVIRVLPDSPADRAGVMTGDAILAIDGKATSAMTMNECLELLAKSRKGPCVISVKRSTEAAPIALKLYRTGFVIQSVPGNAVIVLPNRIGYLRIEVFNQTTASEFTRALQRLREKDVRALILDLRNNPGGLVNVATEVASHFIAPGELIVKAVGRDTRAEELKAVRIEPFWDKIPMVVLLNGASASASEILAGALRDHGKAVLIGEKSFGKGSIQRVMTLPDGGAIKFTIARYYTPKGELVDGRGLTPGVVVAIPPKDTFRLAAQIAAHPGEITPKISNAVTDAQLKAAIAYLEKALQSQTVQP